MWIQQGIIPKRIIGIIDELWQGHFNSLILETANSLCLTKYNFAIGFRKCGPGKFVFESRQTYRDYKSNNRIEGFTIYNSQPYELFIIYLECGKYSVCLDTAIDPEDLYDMLSIFYSELNMLAGVKQKGITNLKEIEEDLNVKLQKTLTFFK